MEGRVLFAILVLAFVVVVLVSGGNRLRLEDPEDLSQIGSRGRDGRGRTMPGRKAA